jgi:malate dehydrogenase (quinone)
MIEVLDRCFAKQLADGWKGKLEQIIPSYGHSLIDDAELTRKVRADTAPVLGLQNV